MKRKDKLLLPMTLAAALAAAPVLAQSPAAQGGATANPSAAGADTRPSTAPGTAQSTTGSSGTTGTTSTTTTTTGATATGRQGTTTMGTTGAMQELAENSVIRHRPRLSQLIGTNVYNQQNETIGEVDDIILSAPAGAMGMGMGMGTTAATPGTTAGTSTTRGATPGAPATGTMMSGMQSGSMLQSPMVVIQVGGFLGMGGRLVVVPLSELQWNTERERVIMPNATKESLQGRPAFTYDSLRRG